MTFKIGGTYEVNTDRWLYLPKGTLFVVASSSEFANLHGGYYNCIGLNGRVFTLPDTVLSHEVQEVG